MEDNEILSKINELSDEEHQLLHKGEHGGLDEGEDTQLKDVKVELDRLWDLLRQRRAREEFGQDPDSAKERSAEVVEKYVN